MWRWPGRQYDYASTHGMKAFLRQVVKSTAGQAIWMALSTTEPRPSLSTYLPSARHLRSCLTSLPRSSRLSILMECRPASDGKCQYFRKIEVLYIWHERGKPRIFYYYWLWGKKPKTNNLHLWLEISAEKNQKPILQDIRASLLCFNIDATVYSDFIGFNLNLKKKPKLLRFFQNKT